MPMPPYDDSAEARAAVNRAFFAGVLHNVDLGIVIETLGRDTAVLRLRYASHLIGDPDTGALHTGPICALLDAACGAAVFQAIPSPAPIATLDLRVEHFRAAAPDLDILATAHCHRVTSDVAFVRCEAVMDGGPRLPVAGASASFMVGTRRGRAAASEPGTSGWTA